MEKFKEILSMAVYAKNNIPFYQKLYADIDLTQLKDEKDIKLLPMITAEDIINNFEELRPINETPYRVTSSSGTLGKPKVIFRAKGDSKQSIEVLKQLLSMAGVKNDDTVFIGQPFDMAHFGYLVLGGCEKIGALAIPAGIAMTNVQYIDLIQLYKPSVICTSLSRLLAIIKLLQETHIDGLPFVKKIILAGEPVNLSGIEKIKSYFHTVPYNFYGSEETDGLAGDCEQHRGLHFFNDLFYMELLHMDGVQPSKKENQIGEAVITSLYQKGMPLIRYRLGDIIEIEQEKCSCGCEYPLIHVYGRAKDAFTLFDGITVMAYQIESALRTWRKDVINYQIVISSVVSGIEEICVKVELEGKSKEYSQDKFSLIEKLWSCSEDLTGIRATGHLRFRVSINQSDIVVTQRGKTKRIIDLRKESDNENC